MSSDMNMKEFLTIFANANTIGRTDSQVKCRIGNFSCLIDWVRSSNFI